MEVVIALDSYDDLFSDFDIRGYAERALSRDFIDELRVRLRKYWVEPNLSLVFLLPAVSRNKADEPLIIARIQRFFGERRSHYRRVVRQSRLKSLLFVVIGLALFIAANWVVDFFAGLPLLRDFFLIPSWFFVWSGLDLMFQNRDEVAKKKRYYAALSDAALRFRDIEGR